MFVFNTNKVDMRCIFKIRNMEIVTKGIEPRPLGFCESILPPDHREVQKIWRMYLFIWIQCQAYTRSTLIVFIAAKIINQSYNWNNKNPQHIQFSWDLLHKVIKWLSPRELNPLTQTVIFSLLFEENLLFFKILLLFVVLLLWCHFTIHLVDKSRELTNK